MGTVNITLANGGLGSTLQTSDGIAGMVLTGTATPSYTLSTPILITRLADMTDYELSAENNPFAWRQVREYYDEAGEGAQLFLMLVAPTVSIATMADKDEPDSAKKLLDFARGKIKLLGIMTDDVAVEDATSDISTASGLNDDIIAANGLMANMAKTYFNAHQPFRAVIGGTSYTGIPSSLVDQLSGTENNRTAILVGDTQSGRGACLGLLLGRLSAVPVMRKVSRVRTGQLSNTAAFINTTAIEDDVPQLSVIASRGYITWCTYPNVSGYYFSGDDTCSATTDDYHFLARGRVIDKAHVLAYGTFVQEVDDEVPVNKDGTLDAGFCQWLSRQIINQVNNTMTVNREISSVDCIIDPAQNILSTNKLKVILRIVPVGYASNIEISLGFNNPAL